jgi:hypothetical protein
MRSLALALACLASLGAQAAPPLPAGAQELLFRRLPPLVREEGRRAPVTVTPAVTLAEEFNDNIFLDNDNKSWDFITFISPSLTVEIEQPTFRLLGSYDFSAAFYARHPEENRAFDQQNFVLDAEWKPTPRLTLFASDTFTYTTDTNAVATEGVATGRDTSWSNGFLAGGSYEIDARTTVRASGSVTVLRFDEDELIDSTTYTALLGAERAFTARLRGILEYEFAHFEFTRQSAVSTHTPRVGVIYQITEFLTGSLRAGPTIEVGRDETSLTPSVIASLVLRMRWGAMGVDYSHLVGTSGGLGGTARTHSAGAFVQVATWIRGLLIEVAPRYSRVESSGSVEDGNRIDVTSFTLPLQVVYRINEYVSLVGAYQFFHQRSDSRIITSTGIAAATDVDQNRLSVGVRFGYPIKFD